MSTTHEELLADIKVSPDSSAARRALGDELRRSGDLRGELIAIQCDLASLADGDPSRRALERREMMLLRPALDAWYEALGIARNGLEELTALDRGLPDRATLSSHTLLQSEARIADATALSRLTLGHITGDALVSLAASRTAGGLRELAMYNTSRSVLDVSPLTSPAFAQLRSLSLSGPPLDDATLRALVTSPHLAQLRSLDLGGVDLTRKGLLAILAEPSFARLRELSVRDSKLRAPWARALAASASVGALERLRLEHDRLDGDGMQAILSSSSLASLTQLSLRENQTESNTPLLVGAALATTLRRLDLTLNALDERWAIAFAAARPLALTHLDLRSNQIGIEGVRALVSAPHLAGLESLSVASPSRQYGMSWGRELASVVALPGFRRLRAFNADNTGVTADGVAALAASPNAAGLRRLRLSFSQIGPDGARALASSPHLADLEALDLGYAHLGDEGIIALCAGHFPRLRHLEIAGNDIGERGHAALLQTRAFPSLRTLSFYECKDPARRLTLEATLGALVDIGDFQHSLELRPPAEWVL